MSLFGSALRDELKPGSDIDILVEFDKDHMPGLFDIAGMEIELAEMFGRKVDLRTPAELSGISGMRSWKKRGWNMQSHCCPVNSGVISSSYLITCPPTCSFA